MDVRLLPKDSAEVTPTETLYDQYGREIVDPEGYKQELELKIENQRLREENERIREANAGGPSDKIDFKLVEPDRRPQSDADFFQLYSQDEEAAPGPQAEEPPPVKKSAPKPVPKLKSRDQDELSIEQMAQLAESSDVENDVQEELSMEQMVAMEKTGAAPPEELTMEQMTKLDAISTIGGRSSPKLMAELGNGPITPAKAANTLMAASEYYKRDHGWLDKIGYALSIPQQFFTRQAVGVLEDLDKISPQDARQLLSNDELVPSDLVNFYIKNPQDISEGAGRWMVGLAADVLLDPLNMIAAPIAAAAKTAKVLGVTKDLSKLSTAERKLIKGAERVEKIIKADGSVKDVKKVDAAIDNLQSGKIGFQDFLKEASVPGNVRPEVRKAFRDEVTTKSMAQELWDGERKITIGARLPFSNHGIEFEIPAVGTVLGGLGKAAGMVTGLPRAAMMQFDGTSKLWNAFSDVSTQTGKILMDAQQGAFQSGINATKMANLEMEKKWRQTFKTIQNTVGDDKKFESIIADVVDEWEMRPLSQEEALQRGLVPEFVEEVVGVKDGRRNSRSAFDDAVSSGALSENEFAQNYAGKYMYMGTQNGEDLFKHIDSREYINVKAPTVKKPNDKIFSYATAATPADIERAKRLETYGLTELVDDLIESNKQIVSKFKERGLPFEELAIKAPGDAKRYAKHWFTKEWQEHLKKAGEMADDVDGAIDEAGRRMGVGGSEKGRSYRGTIRNKNLEGLTDPEKGFKIFVDDPLELASRRALEMERTVQAYDLLDAASAYAVKAGARPGRDWVPFDPSHFSNMILDGAQFGTDGTQVGKLDSWRNFVPDYYKHGHENIYMPADVYDRLLYQIHGHADDKVTAVLRGLDGFMNVFRNDALLTPAYLGTNFAGNMMHLANNSGLGGLRSLGKAFGTMLQSGGDVVVKNGDEAVSMTKAELWAEAVANGVISPGVHHNSFGPLADGIATMRGKESAWSKAKTVGEYAYLWRLNRFLAEKSDQIPKLATYIERRSQGFSPQAAAEVADRYFYNFSLGSRNQDIIGKFVPFSKFPMKTMEYVMSELKDGNLSAITFPAKVQNTLQGAFVEDPEVRAALDKALPGWAKARMPILGDLLPGGRELLLELPWAASTLNMFFNPENAQQPIASIVGAILAAYGADEEYQDMAGGDLTKIIKKNINMLAPVWIREPLAAYDLRTGNLNGWFADDYTPDRPTPKQFSTLETAEFATEADPTAVRFKNSAEFGASVADSWLYKLYFGEGDALTTGPSINDQEIGAKGEFIRKRFRNLALGTASITKMDQNMLMNQLAMIRQEQRLTEKIKSDIYQNEGLIAEGKLDQAQYDEKFVRMYPEVKDLMKLKAKKQALKETYDWFLKMQAEHPNNDMVSTIFGVDASKMDTADAPMVYDNLTIRAEEFADEEAQALINQFIEEGVSGPEVIDDAVDEGMDEEIAPVEEPVYEAEDYNMPVDMEE